MVSGPDRGGRRSLPGHGAPVETDGQQQSQSVVGEVAEAVSDALDLLDHGVGGFGRAVADAGATGRGPARRGWPPPARRRSPAATGLRRPRRSVGFWWRPVHRPEVRWVLQYRAYCSPRGLLCSTSSRRTARRPRCRPATPRGSGPCGDDALRLREGSSGSSRGHTKSEITSRSLMPAAYRGGPRGSGRNALMWTIQLARVRAGQDAPTPVYPASVSNPNNGVIAARGVKGGTFSSFTM